MIKLAPFVRWHNTQILITAARQTQDFVRANVARIFCVETLVLPLLFEFYAVHGVLEFLVDG